MKFYYGSLIIIIIIWFRVCNGLVVSRREIAALQAENYALERQLFSYQKSLAYAQAQAGEAAPAAGPAPREPPQSPERSLSTDTEYA